MPKPNTAPMSEISTDDLVRQAQEKMAADQAEIARLRAENEAMRKAAANASRTSLKVSDKGAVSVYGMGRFPFTLYQEQWLKILDMGDQIRAFIQENQHRLARKGETRG